MRSLPQVYGFVIIHQPYASAVNYAQPYASTRECCSTVSMCIYDIIYYACTSVWLDGTCVRLCIIYGTCVRLANINECTLAYSFVIHIICSLERNLLESCRLVYTYVSDSFPFWLTILERNVLYLIDFHNN